MEKEKIINNIYWNILKLTKYDFSRFIEAIKLKNRTNIIKIINNALYCHLHSNNINLNCILFELH